MNDKERKSDYIKSANEYSRWKHKGDQLLLASNELYYLWNGARDEIKIKKEGIVPANYEIFEPMMYLRVMALENYVKGLYIKRGKLIVNTSDAKFKLKSHDLDQLFIESDVAISLEEKNFLEKLTNAGEYWTRYPVPLKYKDWRPQTSFITGVQPLYSWSEDEERFFEILLDRVKDELIKA